MVNFWRSLNFDERTFIDGLGVLRADFDQSEVNGEITNLRTRPQTSDSYTPLEDNQFVIEYGEIKNGQFVAALKGVDSSTSDSSGTEQSNDVITSIQGFDGNISGEFYGPQANEVGAVLNASRGNSVLYGYLTGSPWNPTGPLEQANSEPLDATVFRDFEEGNMSVSHTDDSTRVQSIRSDGGSGIILTYLIDDTQHTVQFEESDFDGFSYMKISNNREQWLWSNTDGFFTPDFNYFNSYYFTSGDEGGSQFPISLFVNGFQTSVENLPGVEATYRGRAWLDAWQACCVSFSQRESTKGNLSLTAEFGESTIQGLIDEIEYRRDASSAFIAVPNASTVISEGSIDGNQFSANLQGTGDMDEWSGEMSGAFYGPSAEEVGGVIKATTSNPDRVGIGWFGGSRGNQ